MKNLSYAELEAICSNAVGPHEFEPMRRFFNRGRCRRCFRHERLHPIHGWATSRPLLCRWLPSEWDKAIAEGYLSEEQT